MDGNVFKEDGVGREMEERGIGWEYASGFRDTLIAANLGRGRESLGESLLERSQQRYEDKDRGDGHYYPRAYRLGRMTELAGEVAVPLYIISLGVAWPYVLGVDLAIKVVPRVANWIRRAGKKLRSIFKKKGKDSTED